MKSLFLVGLFFMSSVASAGVVKTVTCTNPEVQDNNFVATFRLASGMNGDSLTVKLWVPSGESDGRTFKGECFRGNNRRAPYLTCLVQTGDGDGFDVRLFAKANSIAGIAYIQSTSTRGRVPVQVKLPACAVR
jgi:hypothetical protein